MIENIGIEFANYVYVKHLHEIIDRYILIFEIEGKLDDLENVENIKEIKKIITKECIVAAVLHSDTSPVAYIDSLPQDSEDEDWADNISITSDLDFYETIEDSLNNPELDPYADIPPENR